MTEKRTGDAPRGLILALLLLTGGCAAREAGFARSAGDRVPPAAAAPDLTVPGVVAFDAAEAGGTIHLLLGKAAGAERKDFALSFTRSDDGGATWSPPIAIPTGHAPPARMHRGDDPRIAVKGKYVMALWTARGDGPYGGGPLATALSDDGGFTWRAGPAPVALPLPPGATPARVQRTSAQARDAAATAPTPSSDPSHGHGAKAPSNGTGPGYRFPATAAGADAFQVVWIHAAGDERSLRHARLPFGAAAWSEPVVVDPHICACCWNALKVEPDGTILALYRDQQPSDMSLAVSRDAGRTWENAGRAGSFDWNFDGCPHVGGGIATVAARGGGVDVLATVWTGNAGATGAYVLSRIRDGNWLPPMPLSPDDARGRNTDVAALPATETAAAAWDQPAIQGGQCVFLTVTSDGGRTWSPRRVSPPGENAAYPRVVPLRDRFLVLWTCYAKDGGTSLRLTTVTPG